MKTYRNAERTRQWIRRAFTELMAEKREIEKITVTELCARADISKTTFYYHYEDIYAVAEKFENELIDRLSASLSGFAENGQSAVENLECCTRETIAYLKAHETEYRIAMRASSTQLFAEKLKKILAKKMAENLRGIFGDVAPDRWQVQVCFVTSACVDVVAEYYRGGLPVPFDTVTDVLLEALRKLCA